jgi:hypothetical protein
LSAGTSTLDATRGQTNSAGERLRISLQNSEPKTKYYATATQPQGIQDRIVAQAPVHPRLFSNIIDAKSHGPEGGEIQQQILPAEQANTDLTAAQLISSPHTTANIDIPLSAENQNTNYYRKKNSCSNHPTVNLPQKYVHYGQNIFSATNKCNPAMAAQHNPSPNIAAQKRIPSIAMKQQNSTYFTTNNAINQSNLTHDDPNSTINNPSSPNNAQNIHNSPSISNSPQDDSYHAKDNFNGSNANTQSISLALHRNSPSDNMLFSVLSTEHRSAWKQPSTRRVNFFLQNTVITATSQARTQPRFSGIQTQPNTASSLQPISSAQDDNYHAKDNSHGPNVNIQDIPLALLHNTTSDNMPPSVLSTEHCSE